MTYNDLIAEVATDLDVELSKIDDPMLNRLIRIIVDGQNRAISSCGVPSVQHTLELDGSMSYMLGADALYIERVHLNGVDVTGSIVSPSEIIVEE